MAESELPEMNHSRIVCLLPDGKTKSNQNIKSEIEKILQTGDPLLKFAYLGQGAQAWDKMRSQQSFEVGHRELEALKLICKQIEPQIREHSSPINIIHIGSGNGVEIPFLFDLFHLGRQDTYTAIDISEELLQILIQRFDPSLISRVKGLNFFQADMESSEQLSQITKTVSHLNSGINILVAAGEGTLLSQPLILQNLKSAMSTRDYVLFSIDGCNQADIQTLCNQYDSQNVKEFLSHAIHCAQDAGLIHEKGEFLPTEFNLKENFLEIYYQTEIGQKILILRSFKPTSKLKVKEFVSSCGLTPTAVEKTSLMSFGIACQRTRK